MVPEQRMTDAATWTSVNVEEVLTTLCELFRMFPLINRGFIFYFLDNNSSWFSPAVDCEKRSVSSANHFVAHHPRFTSSECECTKSIYFPKIAISLVYSMKMSLCRDEKESHTNLFGAGLNVIMRFCCTPAILIHLWWGWWRKPVQ